MIRRMRSNPASEGAPVVLGIEAGATRTVAIAVSAHRSRPVRLEAGPANLWLLDDAQLTRLLESIARAMPRPHSLAIGMAGARTPADHARIRRAAAHIWPGVPCYASSDLETGLMAAGEGRSPRDRSRGRDPHRELARVLILSGTGSCCFGRAADGHTVRVGGWGHILGDKASGYEIGLLGVKAVLNAYDSSGHWPELGRRILRALALNEPEDLVGWAQAAAKSEVAALAVEVFGAGAQRDKIAAAILANAAGTLARDAAACARRVARPGDRVQFVLAGSVLLKQPRFAARVGRELRRLWPNTLLSPLQRESVWGAVELARQHLELPFDLRPLRPEQSEPSPAEPLSDLRLSPTEQRNPRSMHLDRLPLAKAVTLMLDEEQWIPKALLAQRNRLVCGVQLIVRSWKRGGRLFYVGAGTSGRLGVLDASECPPTFSVPPDRVQGIIAGGHTALWSSIEGAEDDPAGGAHAIEFRGVGARDTVVGIAASGRTPFVWGALREARRRGATTILLCFNPGLRLPRCDRPTLVIAANVGPELLTGSTRLKAGTATKVVLNLFTTLAMVQLGKVRSNLMIDVQATNTKLRDRAVRIVQALTRADYVAARAALERAGWRIPRACARLGRRQAPQCAR